MLTLVLGVTGGLYLADYRAERDAASAQALFEAEQAEQAVLRANVLAWSKRNAQERAEKAAAEAAEKARLEAEAAAEAARKRAEEEASRKTVNRTVVVGPIPESCNEYTGNRAIGCALMLEAGFALDQMPCLEKLWTKESGWNHLSSNGSSGAYGIPQAVPGSKMATVGDDWKTNPATQIKWGLGYISGRYKTPCGAWQFFQNNNWY